MKIDKMSKEVGQCSAVNIGVNDPWNKLYKCTLGGTLYIHKGQ